MFAERKLRRAASAPEDFEFLGEGSNSANQDSYTFSSEALGALPDSGKDRYMIVTANYFADSTAFISGVTIGGTSTTELIRVEGINGSLATSTGIYMLKVNTGTTADIVLTLNGTGGSVGVIGVYRAIVPDTTTLTVHDTASDSTTSGNGTLTLDVLTVSDYLVIGSCFTNNGTGGHTWVGATEDFDVDAQSNDFGTGASAIATASETRSVTCEATSGNRMAGVAVSLKEV